MAEGDLGSRRQVSRWLFVCAAFIAAMVVIGGITRLTESGLSITEWNLVMGTLPPLDDAQWQEVFAQYRESPEYKIVNRGMSLAEFKRIFWWEYIHRLVGRAIGFVFLVPFLYFVIRRKVTGSEVWKLLILFLLGGAQGVLGWYMVKSGLVKDPEVSHFRLTAHLCLAFVLFGATLWQALQFRMDPANQGEVKKTNMKFLYVTAGLMLLVMAQVALGAMVAGLKAGYMYNTFPKMGETWIPFGMQYSPLHNPVTIQFAHRTGAFLVLLSVVALWWKARRLKLSGRQRGACHFLLGTVAAQFLLGVFTLLFFVPVALGSLHQFGALVLFGGVVCLAHATWRQA